MFSFHVGLPGLHENVLRRTPPQPTKPTSSSYLVSNEDYIARLEPFVITRDKEKAKRSGIRDAAVDFIADLQQHQRVVFSQPLILGSPKDSLSQPNPLPLADGRIARLSRLMHERDVEFHLIITNQIDYFFSQPCGLDFNDPQSLRRTGVSWSLLVDRLRNAAPNSAFFVWDFERPEVAAPKFQAMLLGHDMLKRGYSKETTSSNSIFRIPSRTSDAVAEVIGWLDAQYEEDLQYLGSMRDVALIRSG